MHATAAHCRSAVPSGDPPFQTFRLIGTDAGLAIDRQAGGVLSSLPCNTGPRERPSPDLTAAPYITSRRAPGPTGPMARRGDRVLQAYPVPQQKAESAWST